MAKKIATLLLLALIAFIVLALITARKNTIYIANLCAYANPTVTSTFGTLGCRAQVLSTMSLGLYKCSDIPKPKCKIDESDHALCDSLIKNKHFESTTNLLEPATECYLSWACPELLDDYKKLNVDCQKR